MLIGAVDANPFAASQDEELRRAEAARDAAMAKLREELRPIAERGGYDLDAFTALVLHNHRDPAAFQQMQTAVSGAKNLADVANLFLKYPALARMVKRP